MNFMSVYANIYNSTRGKIFFFFFFISLCSGLALVVLLNPILNLIFYLFVFVEPFDWENYF